MQKMCETRNYCDSRMLAGIILVVLGAFFLLDNLNFINFDFTDLVFSWPSVLIIIGIIILIKSRNSLVGGGFVAAGVFFLLPVIFPWINYDEDIIFPLLLILAGVYVLVKRNSLSRKSRDYTHENLNLDTIDEVSIFGGGEKVITSDNFKGGTITSIFGGSEIDLTASTLSPGANVIDILCIFGGTTLIVPKNWNVRVDVLSLFGGFSNKGAKNSSLEIEKENKLIIKGFVLFGGGEIKSY